MTEKAWALNLIRNTRDTRAIDPFHDMDKRQIMRPIQDVKNSMEKKNVLSSVNPFQKCDKKCEM